MMKKIIDQCATQFLKFGLVTLFISFSSLGEAIDLEQFEFLSTKIKNKQIVTLQDEEPLRLILQYNQPQRKIQTSSELSESSLSAE